MKKAIILSLLCINFFILQAQQSAQVNVVDIVSAVKKIGFDYSDDFKHMKGKLKGMQGDKYVYYSKFKLPGSVDSSNLIYQDKVNKLWYFSADLDRETVSISELLSLLPQMVFSFGNLKATDTEGEWLSVFIPQSKRKASERTRLFHVSLYDGNRNPNDVKGQLLQIRIGGDLKYRDN